MYLHRWSIGISIAGFLLGCGGPSAATSSLTPTAATSSAAESPSPASVSAKFALAILDWQGVQQLVQRHRGQVVAVDVWTTTCPTCLEELPKIMSLGREFDPQQLAVITVNCDYDGVPDKPPEFYRPQVQEALTQAQANGENVMLNVSFLEFLEAINLSSTPCVLVYDRQGKLAKRFDNDQAQSEAEEFHAEDVRQLIEQLVAEAE